MKPKLHADANQFLQFHSRNSRQRGEEYFHGGRVHSISWAEDGSRLDATVTGTQPYTVALRHGKNGWDSRCTCPIGFRCKHAVAAMLALLELSGEAPAGAPGRVLAEKLGRAPTAEETNYLRQVGVLFQRVTTFKRLTPLDLRQLAPTLRKDPYQPVRLWEKTPGDEVEFWQYLAFYFDQNDAEYPEFMRPLCDHNRVGAIMRQLQREEEIQRWTTIIQNHASAQPPVSQRVGDARARLVKKKFVLEIRADGGGEYRPIKRARFLEMAGDLEVGELELPPEVYGIWRAFADQSQGYQSPELDLQEENDAPGLRTLLTQPALQDRVVNEAGRPFEHPVEPLRWEISAPADATEDYRFRLVLPAGAEVLGVLPGAVPLYVTATAVWRGPQPLPGQLARTEVVIPAPAVETTEGVRLLQAVGGVLPARVEQKVRRIAYRLLVSAELRLAYGGVEHVLVRVSAGVAEGSAEQFYLPGGWSRASRFGWGPAARPKPRAKGDVIELVDDSALAAGRAVEDVLGASWNNPDQCWQVRVTKSFPEKFTTWLAGLPAGSAVKLDPELATLREGPVAASVRLECEPNGVDWFDLKVVLDVADTKLTPAELKVLLNARGGFVRLGAKGWRRLQFNMTSEDDAALARLGLAARDFTAEPQRLHALQLADKAAARFLPEEQVAAVRRRAEEIVTRVAPAVPTTVRGELRPYQLAGFHFLAYLSANRFGGILADDMGLGKTLQALTWLAWLREQAKAAGTAATTLVVCPKSVMDNWRAEAERFVPGLRVQLGAKSKGNVVKPGSDVVVVNYTQLRAVSAAAGKVPWLAVILDEGQYIKNPESLTARAARALPAEYRLVLTGTPIENRLLDLWSLMAFAMPGVLGNRTQFAKQFDTGDDPLARQRLAARVRPFLLRRTKGQVATDLPARSEEDLLCEMEGAQATLYRAELKHAQQMLLQVKTRQEFDAKRFNFLTSLLRLRQICCHPALVDAKRAEAGSAKVEALLDVLGPLMEEGHKVLVFSQFVGLLELLRPVIEAKGWKQFWLTGATEERGDLVREFQGTEGAAVFLISLKAGGFGLNLTAASYVVLFDPWWNPAVEAQAIDRTHRIGQTRHVMAYRLLIKGSIEEKIRALQKQKRAVAEDILGEERFTQSLTVEDLRLLFADG